MAIQLVQCWCLLRYLQNKSTPVFALTYFSFTTQFQLMVRDFMTHTQTTQITVLPTYTHTQLRRANYELHYKDHFQFC